LAGCSIDRTEPVTVGLDECGGLRLGPGFSFALKALTGAAPSLDQRVEAESVHRGCIGTVGQFVESIPAGPAPSRMLAAHSGAVR
jgi:hypothetical protein